MAVQMTISDFVRFVNNTQKKQVNFTIAEDNEFYNHFTYNVIFTEVSGVRYVVVVMADTTAEAISLMMPIKLDESRFEMFLYDTEEGNLPPENVILEVEF